MLDVTLGVSCCYKVLSCGLERSICGAGVDVVKCTCSDSICLCEGNLEGRWGSCDVCVLRGFLVRPWLKLRLLDFPQVAEVE